jgi:para-aminobenzoate synthetase component 1
VDLLGRIASSRLPFLLLGGDPGGKRGRWSILGCDPFETWTLPPAAPASREGDPFSMAAAMQAAYPTRSAPGMPFCGGVVGYFGYECHRFVEQVPVRAAGRDDPPDAHLAAYASAVVVDGGCGDGWIVATGWPEADPPSRRARAEADVDRLRRLLGRAPAPPAPAARARDDLRSSLPREQYLTAVGRILAHIRAGDVYQANLTQRLERPMAVPDAPALFARMQQASPAPHAAYLDLGSWKILSTSPERFLSLRGRRAESRPIKGTARRGSDPADDRARRRALLAGAKERAESLMIVDLVRNDLNRVCRPGSVRVSQLARVETYATLHHLVAAVEGTLREGRGVADLLRALFPPGSMTGAPKVRAMQILHDLEPVRRGPYSGGLGYLSFAGDLDLSVVIRTVMVGREAVRFHVGGGVVADSDPEAEYDESLLKARAIFTALDPGA